MTTIKEVLDNAGGATMIAGCIVLRPLVQPRYSSWNATAEELQRALPGDERVPAPLVAQTMAVTIAAKPERVWPWVAQIGQERGGLYSYELLENLARCNVHNADRVVPEWELGVGDRVRLGPEGYPVWGVVGLERGCWLLLAGADLKTAKVDEMPKSGQREYINFTWLFNLDERQDGTTRLLLRNRLDYAPRTFANKLMWEWMTDPIGFVMARKLDFVQFTLHNTAFLSGDLPMRLGFLPHWVVTATCKKSSPNATAVVGPKRWRQRRLGDL